MTDALPRLCDAWAALPSGQTTQSWCSNPWQAGAPLQLYDTWVTRDAGGAAARKLPPYLRDAAGARRLAAGLPAPVACCWNGLAVLDASPLRAGLRMRWEVWRFPEADNRELHIPHRRVVRCRRWSRLDAAPLRAGLRLRFAAARRLALEVLIYRLCTLRQPHDG